MTTFRLRRPNFSSFTLSISVFKRPLLLLLFIFFLTSSSDLLHAYLLLFKIKVTNGIAFLLFAGFFVSQTMKISKEFSLVTLAVLGCMILSLANSPNIISSLGFTFFFLFNYLFYFLISYNQFRFFSPETVLKVYSVSFYCTGFYALAQVLLSIGGIILPGVTQYIGNLARGSAFAYEPSFYALYMTPFAMYASAKFILQNREERRIGEIFWPNVFLLASTSTGCFFSYLFFLFFIISFRYLKIIHLSINKLLFKFFLSCLSAFSILWVTNRQLIDTGFLKFFYRGGTSHFSVFDRWRGLMEYWNIFVENPLIGVGFGGGPFYLAQKKGIDSSDLLNPQILALYSPMNVTTEVLASVGILGGLCFLYFFYLLISLFLSALRISSLTEQERIILISFALSICVMFMTLQFNQSIMRAYMWIHIGIFSGYAQYLKGKYALQSRLSV